MATFKAIHPTYRIHLAIRGFAPCGEGRMVGPKYCTSREAKSLARKAWLAASQAVDVTPYGGHTKTIPVLGDPGRYVMAMRELHRRNEHDAYMRGFVRG